MRTLLCSAALLGALFAAPLGAVPSAADIKASFQLLDVDRNGEASLREWENLSIRLFASLDTNRDRSLEPAEIQSDLLAASIFTRIDLDVDGRLSLREFMALRYAIFRAADIDSTQSLNFVEYELLRLLAESGWNDANNNSRIEIPELRVSLQKVFADADLDRDGRLTATEAKFIQPEEFPGMTENGAALEVEELIASYKRKLTAP